MNRPVGIASTITQQSQQLFQPSNNSIPASSGMIDNFFGMNPRAIVLTQVLNFSRQFIDQIHKKYKSSILTIFALLVVSSISMNFDKICFKSSGIMNNIAKWILLNIFMRRESFCKKLANQKRGRKLTFITDKDTYNVDSQIYYETLMEKLELDTQAVTPKIWKKVGNGYAMIEQSNTNGITGNKIDVHYNTFLSGGFFDQIKKISHEKTLIQGRIVKLVTSINSNRCSFVEKNQQAMFPYKKYLHLRQEISNFFKVNDIVARKKPVAIIINGPPGTGKTSFCDYISQQGICNQIIKVNMMSFTKIPLNDIVSALNETFSLQDNDLVCFDEIDKYFDIYIRERCLMKRMISKKQNGVPESPKGMMSESKILPEESSGATQDDIPITNGDCQSKTLPEKRHPEGIESSEATQDEIRNEACVRESNDFLSSLMTMIDGEELSSNIIFIFCANNFDTIYRYATMHFEALKSRFIRENIKEYSVSDVKDFLTYYNKFFNNTELETDQEVIDFQIKKLPDDFSIDARTLNHLLIKHHYNIARTIMVLINDDYTNECSSDNEDQ